ncbi:MAG: FecCD family ABC transporter permease [Myxococcota bacterium]
MIGTLLIAVVIASLLGLGVGALPITPFDAVRTVLHGLLPGVSGVAEPAIDAVIWHIRLPRTALGLTVGAALATAGALFQGLFRNPLADPGLLGITLGAAAAVALAVLGSGVLVTAIGGLDPIALAGAQAVRPYVVPVAAFIGSLVSVLAVVALSGGLRQLDVATLLLGGIAINAIAGAITGLCIFLADDAQLRDLTFWSLGGLGGATWPVVMATVPPVVVGLCAVPFLARRLDCLQLGEAEAAHLGVPIESTKRWVVGVGALLVGVSVAAAGAIGFIGLVVPHLVRLFLGPGHRMLLPASALLGAALVVLADVLARTVVAPAELPIGVLTTLLGGPFFLGLLIADRRRRGT